jgi:hypothetical protein
MIRAKKRPVARIRCAANGDHLMRGRVRHAEYILGPPASATQPPGSENTRMVVQINYPGQPS